MSEVLSFEDHHLTPRPARARRPGKGDASVFFDRRELGAILQLYGRMVAVGEWRDYAIAHDARACTFAVFRRTTEGALYHIRKEPKLAARQGAWSVSNAAGRILKRGHDLQQVLKVFESKRFRLVD